MEVFQVVKVLLPLTVVPAETLVQGGKPVGDLVLGTDGRHGVYGGGDAQAVVVMAMVLVVVMVIESVVALSVVFFNNTSIPICRKNQLAKD